MSYRLYLTPQPLSVLGEWNAPGVPFTHVVGDSVLGHFVVWSQPSNEFGVLHPLVNAFKNYGPFGSVDAFREAVLDDPDFAAYVLRPDHVAELRELLGDVGDGQVYIPAPLPALGGSDAPETYMVVDLAVFASITAQAHGLG